MAMTGYMPYVIAGSIVMEALALVNIIPAPALVYIKAAFGGYFILEALKYTYRVISTDVVETELQAHGKKMPRSSSPMKRRIPPLRLPQRPALQLV